MEQVRHRQSQGRSWQGAVLLGLATCLFIGEARGVEVLAKTERDEAWLSGLLAPPEADQSLAGSVDFDLGELAETADLLRALESLNSWSLDGQVRGSLGYKRNALYAPRGEVDSAYSQLEVDLFALRPGLGERPDFTGFLYADYRAYADVPGLDGEHLAVGQAQLSTRLWAADAKGALSVGAAHSQQALDASLDDYETTALSIRLWRPEVKALVEQGLGQLGTARAALGLAQARFSEATEDYSERSIALEWSRPLLERSQLAVRWEGFEERYEQRLSRTSQGDLVDPRIPLEIQGNRWQAEWQYAPVDGPLRLSKARLLYQVEDDRVGGFYERDRWELRESLEWAWGPWSLETAVAYGNLGYAGRPAAWDDAAPREDRSVRLDAELARQMGERWQVYARLEWADKDSTSSLFAYESSSAAIGLSLSKVGNE